MAASETSVCNLALGRLGEKQIQSLDEASPQARFCQRFYSQTRDEVLRSHTWNFASKREVLSRLADAPVFGWAYQFQLPADFLRMVELNSYGESGGDSLYQIEGNRLLTNDSEAKVRYTARVTDANLFDPLFIEALATKLASKIAVPLSGSRQAAGDLLGEYTQMSGPTAKVVDAREGNTKQRPQLFDSPLVRSRGRWGRRW